MLLVDGTDSVVDKIVLERFYTKAGRVASVITFLAAEWPSVGSKQVGRVFRSTTDRGVRRRRCSYSIKLEE